MLLIHFFRFFIQQDTKNTLQRRISNILNKKVEEVINPTLKEQYLLLVDLAEKVKHRKHLLTHSDKLFLARHYNSLQNELNGKSVKYDL